MKPLLQSDVQLFPPDAKCRVVVMFSDPEYAAEFFRIMKRHLELAKKGPPSAR